MASRLVICAFLGLGTGCAPVVEDEASVMQTGSSSSGDPSSTSGGSSGASPSGDAGSTGDPTGTTSGEPPVTTSGGASSASTGGGGESSSGVPFDPDCQGRCASLAEGSCIGQLRSCAMTCEDAVGNQGEAVASAFEVCVSTNPLCFSFLEDCMWAELYGAEPVEQVYAFTGVGFDAWEGRTVQTRLFEIEQEATTTITGGQFSTEVTVTASFDPFYNPRTFYYYVDLDQDGACTAADYVQTAWLDTLGTDFSDAVFTVETMPDLESNANLCSQF